MRIVDSRRVLFVHIPKTGGSTLDFLIDGAIPSARKLPGRGVRHWTVQQIVEADPALDDYWSCAFVRNPWARLVSWFSMARAMQERVDEGIAVSVEKVRSKPHVWEPLLRYGDDFSRFVIEGMAEHPRLGRPQVDYLTYRDGRQVDFVGRTENFHHDTNVLLEHLGLPTVEEVPHHNSSPHRHWSEYYTPELRDRVAEVYRPDLEAFGYTFDG